MSKRFKYNIYTKCYCILRFLSAAAQNLCESPTAPPPPPPWCSTHLHSSAEQVLHPEPHFSSLRGWCPQRWELETHTSSSVLRHPARGKVIHSSCARRKMLRLSASLTSHRCSARLAYYLTFLLGFACSHPVAVPSSPDLHVGPPVPAMSYVAHSSCCPRLAGD